MSHNGKLFIETVGCQMNVLDSELVVAALRKEGYELTASPKDADTVLFNTCSVRELAEHKIYSRLGKLKYAKRDRPELVIGVMGCMAQKDQDLIFKKAPHVDLVVGTGQLQEIPKLVADCREDGERRTALSLARTGGSRDTVSASFQSYDPLREPEMRPSPFQAYVRITIGCDKFCSYCVVPMTRGPEQSRSPSEIKRECEILADQGVKEVTLLGQTVNSYKQTEDGKLHRLSDLLERIHPIPGIERIKFVTNYPKDMTNDLLDAVRDLPKATTYLHVPAQSGCNDVLKLMKRGYTVEDYREMMGRIRERVPGCSVSSDFIVGHPGETEASFDKSMDLVRECRFKNSFVFKYSPRPGTKAHERLPDDIPEDEKKRRNNLMLDLQNRISEEDNAEFIGEHVKVLVEGPSKKAQSAMDAPVVGGYGRTSPAGGMVQLSGAADSGGQPSEVSDQMPESGPLQLVGRTSCDRIAVFDANPRLAGSVVDVEIDDCTATTLVGHIVTRQVQHGSNELLPILG